MLNVEPRMIIENSRIFPSWARGSTPLSYPKPSHIYVEVHIAYHFGDTYHDKGLVTLYSTFHVFVGFVPYHGIEALLLLLLFIQMSQI